MQNNLFKKCIVFTDLHFGLRHNSKDHNDDCMSFIKWMCELAKTQNIETCIFMGDYQHHRNTLNILTQNYMIDGMKLLNDNFNKTYFLVGNHDMFWRERREITSTKFASLFSNIEFIDNIVVKGDVALIPWLVEDEWKTVKTIESKYIFGHLELPGFKMNAAVEMPDRGHLNSTHFPNQDMVFSGHFHKRQSKGKVHYVGNPFGHNFSDVWDFERGAMILEWGKDPEFIDYTEGPRFINIPLSSLMEDLDLYLKPKTHLQVVIDTPITYEDAVFLRETFMEQYSIREFKIIKPDSDNELVAQDGDISCMTIDDIVIDQLSNMDSNNFDLETLVEIYDRL